jgi:ankyrin repeat protein
VSDASAIFDAIESHDLDRLSLALAEGGDANARTAVPPHWSPLHAAINELEDGGPIEALVLLMRYGANVEGAEGDTPLLMALYRAQPEAVHLLLAAGANANVRGPEGDSPLRVAVERSDHGTAAMLLRCGAQATINDAGAPTGASALGIAAMRLDVPMIALLLQAGADPDALDADHLTARDRIPSRTPENANARDEAERLLAEPAGSPASPPTRSPR